MENLGKYPVNITNAYYVGTLNMSGNYATSFVTTKLEESQLTDGTLLESLNSKLQPDYALWVAGKYLDLTFQPDMQTDSNGYNYNESTYIMADPNWTKVAEKKAGTTIHVNEFDLSDKMLARYIKLDDLKTPEVISFSLCEVEAYGMRIDDISLVKRYALAYLYKNPQIIFQ